MIEYTLMNVLLEIEMEIELKLYCGPDKFYGRSKFGQYDEVNDRAPLFDVKYIITMCMSIHVLTYQILIYYS